MDYQILALCNPHRNPYKNLWENALRVENAKTPSPPLDIFRQEGYNIIWKIYKKEKNICRTRP